MAEKEEILLAYFRKSEGGLSKEDSGVPSVWCSV